MTKRHTAPEPAWVARFLAALKTESSVRAAAKASGTSQSTAYSRRKAHPDFAAEWAAIKGPVDNAPAGNWGGARKIGAKKLDRFLEALAESSNVRAAAAIADVSARAIYRLRRDDAAFARRWYAALAEGYDNLEMELLENLRSGGDGTGGETRAKKFDTATALRCLTAHRESVAREKGRRTLADEVTTIAAINEKIDAMRARKRESDAAIRKARRVTAKRSK